MEILKHPADSLLRNRTWRFAMMLVLILCFSVPSFAQVALEIPTDELFTSANGWIETFVPIFGIGFGITIAIAVLNFFSKIVTKAFK